jgi:hypothetical protein
MPNDPFLRLFQTRIRDVPKPVREKGLAHISGIDGHPALGHVPLEMGPGVEKLLDTGFPIALRRQELPECRRQGGEVLCVFHNRVIGGE